MNTQLQAQLAPYADEIRQKLTDAPAARQSEVASGVAEPQAQVIAQLTRDLETWWASAGGIAKVKAMQSMSLPEIQQELRAIMASGVFAPTLTLISAPSFPILDHPIKSIFVALKVEVVVLVGLSLSIGAAFDVKDMIQFLEDPKQGLPQASFYISGWGDLGVDAGAFTGVEAGVSASEPGDFGGMAFGVEGTYVPTITGLPEPVGISAQVYSGLSAGSWGALVAIAVGADGGFELTASYTIVLADIDTPNIYQPTPQNGHMLRIDILCCENSNENTDAVYLESVPDGGASYRFPYWDHRNMMESDNPWEGDNTWYPGVVVKFVDSVVINMWSETTGNDDSLGSVTFAFGDFSGPGNQINRTYNRDGDIGNGWNQITYKVYATLLY